MSLTLTFDEVIAFVGQRPQLRLLAIDGLPLAGKTTLADRLAVAIGGACVFLDDFIKPEREWRWRDRHSFPFDFVRHDEFVGAVRSLAADAGTGGGTIAPASVRISIVRCAWIGR